ncbi:MAG TPA: DUF2017 family protein [Actinomycetota bacterium]|nr:DUF2017 family protein [Actinomycetota bacterium]
MRGPFVRRRSGDIDVTLTAVEADLIRSVVEQMTGVLDDPPPRLLPPAYEDDPEAQAEYASLMTADLMDGKRRALASMKATIERGKIKRDGWRATLTEDEAQDWLAVVNDARLTLGTNLNITEDSYERDIDPTDPDAASHEVFRYLGFVEEYLVDALMG